jgi:hypothetical protein
LRFAALMLTVLAILVGGTTRAEAHEGLTNSYYRESLTKLRPHVNGILINKCRPTYPINKPASRILYVHYWWHVWIQRHKRAHEIAKAPCWSQYESHFHNALTLASRTYGVSYSWLHNCGHSEGSDRMVWNHGGSGAFGPMQFMRGTFYGNVGSAWSYAWSRGVRVPTSYKRWNSNLGQAMTAAYMFRIGQSGQWTGAGC